MKLTKRMTLLMFVDKTVSIFFIYYLKLGDLSWVICTTISLLRPGLLYNIKSFLLT